MNLLDSAFVVLSADKPELYSASSEDYLATSDEANARRKELRRRISIAAARGFAKGKGVEAVGVWAGKVERSFIVPVDGKSIADVAAVASIAFHFFKQDAVLVVHRDRSAELLWKDWRREQLPGRWRGSRQRPSSGEYTLKDGVYYTLS